MADKPTYNPVHDPSLTDEQRRAYGNAAADEWMKRGTQAAKLDEIVITDQDDYGKGTGTRQGVQGSDSGMRGSLQQGGQAGGGGQRIAEYNPLGRDPSKGVLRPFAREADPSMSERFSRPDGPDAAPAIPHDQDWENQKAELAQQRAAMAQQQAEVQAAKVQAAKEAAMKALAQPKKSKARQKSLDQLAKELEAEMAGQMSGWQSSPAAVTPTQTDIPWLRGR